MAALPRSGRRRVAAAFPNRPFLVEWLLLGVTLLLLGTFMAYGLLRSHAEIETHERERLSNQAHVIDANLARQLDAVNHALSILRDAWASEKTQADGVEKSNRQQRAFVDAMPLVRTLAILDAHGTVLSSSQTPLINRNFRDRPYFQVPVQNPEVDTLYVSPPFKTVLGFFAMTVSRVIGGGQGEFAGVIVATLDPEEFEILLRSVRYAPDMQVGLNHGDGTVIMTATQPELAGQSLAVPGSFYSRHVASGRQESFFMGPAYSTGEERFVAVLTIQPPAFNMDRPLMVAVSRERSALYAPWRDHAYAEVGLYGLLVAMTVTGLVFFQRRRRGFQRDAELSATQLADSERNLRTIVENQPQGVSLFAPDGVIVHINPAGREMIEADAEAEVIGTNFIDFIIAPQRDAFRDLCQSANAGASGSLVFEVVGRKGGQRWLETHVVPMRNSAGVITGQLGVTLDVTERRAIAQELERLSQTDALTELANRRHFMSLAEQEVSRTARYGGTLSVLMLDVDHFKSVNDSYGHQVGDAVLRQLAGLCREALRDVDVVGRIGGEEFAVLLPQTGGAPALEAAERLRELIAASEIHLEQGRSLHFTVSIGGATLHGAGATVDTLLSQADSALYEAKRAGRNRVCMATAT